MTRVKISMTKLGSSTKSAKPSRIDMNSGLAMISLLIFCRQKGHFI